MDATERANGVLIGIAEDDAESTEDRLQACQLLMLGQQAENNPMPLEVLEAFKRGMRHADKNAEIPTDGQILDLLDIEKVGA